MSNRTPETAAIIKAAGGVMAMSRSLGLTPAAVSKWIVVPKKYDARITELTGKTREQIRQEIENGNNAG
jgi:predicted transcriptional regulator